MWDSLDTSAKKKAVVKYVLNISHFYRNMNILIGILRNLIITVFI